MHENEYNTHLNGKTITYDAFDYFCEDFDINRIPIDLRSSAYVNYISYINKQPWNLASGNRLTEEEISSTNIFSSINEVEAYDPNEPYDIFSDSNKYENINVSNIHIMQRNLKELLNIDDWQLYVYSKNGVRSTIVRLPFNAQSPYIVVIPNIDKNEKLVCDLAESLGYFLTTKKDMADEYGKMWLGLFFNPHHQDTIDTYVRENVSELIHCTSKELYKKIAKEGLIPDTNSPIYKSDVGRIYFYCGLMPWNKDKSYTKMLKQLFNTKQIPQDEWMIIGISTDKIPSDVHFYADPNQTNCCYITKAISSDCITRLYQVARKK